MALPRRPPTLRTSPALAPHSPGYRPLPFRRTPTALPARQARSRITRERLLGAVESVIREGGLERATVRAIAARAGVSVGTVYRRFPHKRALLETARERFNQRRQQRTLAALRLAQSHELPVQEALA